MIAVEHEPPDFAEPHVQARCCFCREFTRYWVADVACCQRCALYADPSDVPSKKVWRKREQIAAAELLIPGLSPVFRIHATLASALYEKQKNGLEDFLRSVFPEIKPRAFCQTLYRMVQAGVGIPVGSFICSSCEEVWPVRDLVKALEHELDGLCIPVAVEYRSELARLFHRWRSEKGFTIREAQT